MRKLAPVILVAAALASALVVKSYSGYTLDDSYIGYRFADNIAQGRGFVYNPGERELGTTTPLYILLLAGLRFLGIPLETAGTAVGTLAFAGTVLLAFLLARRLMAGETIAFLLGLGVCAFPPLLREAVSGMETSLYACLTLLLLYLYLERRLLLFSIFGAVIFLVRPDGAVLLAVCGIHDLLTRRGTVRLWIRNAAIVLGLTLPWFVFARLYFGVFLPNSGFAKLLQVEDWGPFSRMVAGFSGEVAFLLPLALLSAPWIYSRCREALLLVAYLAGFCGFFILAGFPGCHWYLGPALAPFLILTALGAAFLVTDQRAPRAITWTVVCAIVGLQSVRTPEDLRAIKRSQAYVEAHHGAIGRWLAANSPESAIVAVDNIGYVGWFSQRRIIDITGLIQSKILEGIRRSGNRRYAIETTTPDYLVLQNRGATPRYTPGPEWFAEHRYHVVFSIPINDRASYQVWKRGP